ncbi:MAG: nicotinate-nucleotide adenylyltransferase [Rhizobiales bacterium]|nr:nicotinate-nucleotide adenylyltransferase [Hyphomicrobiales bacterium]
MKSRPAQKVPASQRLKLPLHAPGLRIGLLGGSFNPPHAAHRAISLFAMKRLRLDRIWWLVTPGNPLKDTRTLTPIDVRIAAAQEVADHPRIDVTGLEAVIGTQYSYDTIAYLMVECPGVRFVWIMGADNLKQFHRWKNWLGIAGLVPIAVIDRGGVQAALSGPAASQLASARIAERLAGSLITRQPPVWVFLHGLKSTLSSTAIRAAAKKG